MSHFLNTKKAFSQVASIYAKSILHSIQQVHPRSGTRGRGTLFIGLAKLNSLLAQVRKAARLT